MPDQCPYLEYRSLQNVDEVDGPSEAGPAEPRAFCTAAQQFVQPMRADICNDRYGLDHETDCEIFRDHENLPETPETGGTGDAGDIGPADGAGGD